MPEKLIGIYNLYTTGSWRKLIAEIGKRQDVKSVSFAPISFPVSYSNEVGYVDGIVVLSNESDSEGLASLDDYLKSLNTEGYHATMISSTKSA